MPRSGVSGDAPVAASEEGGNVNLVTEPRESPVDEKVDAKDVSAREGASDLGLEIVYPQGSDIPVVARPHNRVIKALFGAKIKPVPQERLPSPKSYKNILSLLTWGWVSPILHIGFNRYLELNDIFLISEDEKNERRMKDYTKKLEQYKKRGSPVNYAEFWALLYALRWPFILSIGSAALYIAGELGMSLMSRKLIELVDDIYLGQTSHHGHATAFAIGSTLVQLGFQLFLLWNQYRTRMLAEFVRTMLISSVYDKITKLSPQGRQMYPASKITSVITTDTNRIFMAARWTSMLLIFLPAFGGMLGILIYNIGVAALAGAGLVLLGIVINVFVSRIITKLRLKSLPFADARIARVRETVENMRIIKFYGWESSFIELVSKARFSETGYLKKLGIVEGGIDAVLTSIPQFGGILSFAVRIIIGKNLPAALAFPSLTLFQLFVPLSMMFSQGVTSHADAWASVKRLNEFYRAPEEPSYVIKDNVDPGSIKIANGAFRWDYLPTPVADRTSWRRKLWLYKRRAKVEDEAVLPELMNPIRSPEADPDLSSSSADDASYKGVIERAGAKKFPGLRNINLEIMPKELIMVVGSIGSGKTTLLNSILGLTPKIEGEVRVGGVSKTVMSMWSQNASIKDNILFGCDYDEKRYKETVFACSLETDFANIAGGDEAEVGERGITLSGGQKARIALARCVYAGGDIVFLDDVLSAVDGKVSNHIFKNCIKGVLKDRTRLLVTHNINLLKEADRVIFMDGGGHAHLDRLENLLSHNSQFKEMYYEATNTPNESDASLQQVRQEVYTESLIERRAKAEDYDDDDSLKSALIESKESVPLHHSNEKHKEATESKAAQGKLMQEEQRFRGTVSSTVLYYYLSSGAKIGIFFVPVIIFFQFANATAYTMQSVFLQFWTSDRYHHPNGVYIGYYCLIVALRMFIFLSVAISICVFCFNSSSKLHNKAVENIYRARMSYFDSTPLGRIINRFTDDTANLDTQMYMQIRMALLSLSMLLASIVAIFVYIPWAILALLPILITAFVLLNYYRASARELKRINSIYRSSMFTLVTESISGMAVILSFGREKEFSKDLNKRIDDMNSSFQLNLSSQTWLSLRVAMASLSVTLIVLLLSVYQVFDLDASKVGMLLSMLPSVSISIVILLPMLAELENEMNSVERLYELAYTLPQEAPLHIEETAPPSDWPQRGRIEFDNVSLKYRPNLPFVLDNFNVAINGGEKVGICGRTGAGKSTIISALFRLVEVSSGRIVIDDVDVTKIGLKDLRTKLAIIPQEPVLFQGTIRSNLDPFHSHTDVELWDALRRSGVIRPGDMQSDGQVPAHHRFHLDTKSNSDGSNFSLGESQLLTLARALVRDARIIVLDEATSAVDFETDKMIQKTIFKEFNNKTILCIAHRLQTIINYDRVMVMDSGRVAEMGDPRALFDDKTTMFAAMCKESGITEKDFEASNEYR